jgi:hypothetical protein
VKKQYILMKRAIILGSVLSVFVLMLVSCASSPEATTTTTRQTTGTSQTTGITPTHAPGGFASAGGQGTDNHGY